MIFSPASRLNDSNSNLVLFDQINLIIYTDIVQFCVIKKRKALYALHIQNTNVNNSSVLKNNNNSSAVCRNS